RPLHDRHIGLVRPRTSDRQGQSHLSCAQQPGVGHVVAVTNVGNASPFQIAKMLTQRLQCRENLAGVEHISEAVDNWDSCGLCEFYDRAMGKRADDNAVIIARQDTPKIFDGLTQAQDDLWVLKITGIAPELGHAYLERGTRA